jgi:Hexapeptide repeat of succinyl-transferase
MLEYQARQTMAAAESAAHSADFALWREIAIHGFQYLKESMWDHSLGGWYRMLDRTGTPGEDVWIGASCTILDGTRIGNGAVIGAGSVVTKDIDPYMVAVGASAQVVRTRQEKLEERDATRDRRRTIVRLILLFRTIAGSRRLRLGSILT